MPLDNTCSAFEGCRSGPASSPGLFSVLGNQVELGVAKVEQTAPTSSSQLASWAPGFLFLFFASPFHQKRTGRLRQPCPSPCGGQAQVQSPPLSLACRGPDTWRATPLPSALGPWGSSWLHVEGTALHRPDRGWAGWSV